MLSLRTCSDSEIGGAFREVMPTKSKTVELISVRCVCGKAVIRATVTQLSVGVMSATVPDKVVACPACGSTDLNAAREKAAKPSK